MKIGGGSALVVDIGAVDTIGAPNTVSPLSASNTDVDCAEVVGWGGWLEGVTTGAATGALEASPGAVPGVTYDAKIAAASRIPPAPHKTCFSITSSNTPFCG